MGRLAQTLGPTTIAPLHFLQKEVHLTTDLIGEIEQGIEHHARWYSRDFTLAQSILWIGILASAGSALIAAEVFDLEKWKGALIAAIPGVVIVVDKSFKFAARASWHSIFRTSLKGLRRDIRDNGMPHPEVAAKLSKLEEDMEKLFPSLDTGMMQKAP